MSLFKKRSEPYCLVLSGGGAKGIFHIGAWKALKELGIEANAFIGNSVGAIIAGFLAQGNDEKLYEIAENLSLDFFINIPENLIENGELKISLKHLSDFSAFYKKSFIGGGIDTSPLRKVLTESLDEELIRKSGNDLGVVTFNLSDMKAKEVLLEQMEEGTLIEYLMASSAFPGFAHPVIDGKKFIDGGVYDNIPYKLARSRGYKKIIIIDISGLGRNKRPNIEGSETIYIKNSINMGGVLDFNRKFLNDFLELGYLDTMKTFGKLKGYNYFIVPDRKYENLLSDLLEERRTEKILEPYLDDKIKDQPISIELKIRSILPNHMGKDRGILYSLLDCCASIFKLDRVVKYSVEELFELLKKEIIRDEEKLSYLDNVQTESETKQLIQRLDMIVKKTTPLDSLKESPYHNIQVIDKVLKDKKTGRLLQRSLHSLYPELNPGLFFLELFGK